MASFDLLSIGHSNMPADRFIGLLRGAGATAIADVRSVPASRRFPWFSGKNLAARLQQEGMAYLALGDALGGRPRERALYRDGVADYEAMANRSEFAAGIERLLAFAEHGCVCMMCAEREPLDCHRCLLVSRALAERGFKIGHILHDVLHDVLRDAAIEPHAATEARLLAQGGATADLFATGQREQLAAAYRRRARAVAYREKPSSAGAGSAENRR
jgi:uncharacterized protein (DUF488 family)